MHTLQLMHVVHLSRAFTKLLVTASSLYRCGHAAGGKHWPLGQHNSLCIVTQISLMLDATDRYMSS